MNLSRKKKIILAVGTVLFLAVVCGFVAVMAIGGNREGNAQEQLSLGERYLAEMDYERAVAAFELAIELEPRNIDAYVGLVRAYEGLGDTDLAMEALETAKEKIQELVREGEALPDSAAEVYLMLVRMYEETGNYEEARLLLEEALSVTDSAELQEIWEAYVPEVEFSLAAGEYEEGTELTLATKGQAVYYTLDGSDPVQEGEGTAEVVIVLQEGNWTIRATAEGRGGMLGDVTEGEYVVAAVESTEGTEEMEPESVESTETGGENVLLTFQIGEALGIGYISADPYRTLQGEISTWANFGLRYPMRNQDITGTITVLEWDSETVIAEKNFESKAAEFEEDIEIEVPYRDRYWFIVSAEGYMDCQWGGYTYESFGINRSGGNAYLIPTDVEFGDVVEIKFLDGSGNFIYPDNLEYYYMNAKNEFVGGGSGHRDSNPGAERGYYVRYSDGITMGVRAIVSIDSTASDREMYAVSNVYPIIPDENGIAYITLSDSDL